MRGQQGRWIGLAAALVAVLVFVTVAAWTQTDRSRDLPGASVGASDDPPGVGPIVYYEVLDASGSHLFQRRLDGRSLARIVASRTDVDYGRTWIVDPSGTMAIALVPGPNDEQQLEAISIATGASLWSARTPAAPIDQAAWSPDGRRFAVASLGTDRGPREAIVVDATTGTFARAPIPDDSIIQGFGPDGGLVLRQHIPSPQGVNVGWRFLRLDPATGTVEGLGALPDVGPASDWSEDVAPGAGLGVDTTLGANDQGTAIRLWTLRGGNPRVLATLPSIDRIGIDPAASGVAISAAQTIRFVSFGGGATDLFTGPDPISDFSWSSDGDYLAVSTDRRGPNLTIVERATGRSVELPRADAVAQLLLVRIVGGVPLPETALPPVEPGPSPTPAPSGPDVAGFGGLFSAWVERTADAQLVHVQRLVPTEAGGLRVVAEMPVLDLGPAAVPDDGGPQLELLPRPRSDDLLVWIGAERSTGWLWDGRDQLKVLDLPSDWPDNAYDVAWRPDGVALAASAGRATVDGDFEGIFVIASPADRATTVVPIVGSYDRLQGWWSADELRVGHGICTDGCEGRFALSARLRIRDHRLVELAPADRARAPIDEASMDAAGPSIVLSMINDDPADNVSIDWPATFGSVDALDLVGFAADGRSLLVAQPTATGTDLYRIDDPIGRAVGGRLADPKPIRLLALEGRGLRLDASPDDRWVIVIDRVDNVRLVRLSDGRSWSVDRERTLAWHPPG